MVLSDWKGLLEYEWYDRLGIPRGSNGFGGSFELVKGYRRAFNHNQEQMWKAQRT